jgi:hypothetical protein
VIIRSHRPDRRVHTTLRLARLITDLDYKQL